MSIIFVLRPASNCCNFPILCHTTATATAHLDVSIERRQVGNVGRQGRQLAVGRVGKVFRQVGRQDRQIGQVGRQDRQIGQVGRQGKQVDRVGRQIGQVGRQGRKVDRVGKQIGQVGRQIGQVGRQDSQVSNSRQLQVGSGA